MPLNQKLRDLKYTLQSKRLGLVCTEWLQKGDPPAEKRPRLISAKKMEDMVRKIQEKSYSSSKRKLARRGHGTKKGGNSILFFNKKRGHAVKIFPKGTDGDFFNHSERTFQKTLSYCLAQIRGQTFSHIEKDIRKTKEQLERIRSTKRDPSIFHPNPENMLVELRKKQSAELSLQQQYLKGDYFLGERKSRIIPFVYSIRLPKIFSERRLDNGDYAVSMEYVNGPTLSELLEGLEKIQETKQGIQAANFIKKNSLDPTTLRTKIVLINRVLVEASTRHVQNSQTPFIPRLDSFIVEGVDKHGNLKLVLVDNA